MRHLERILLVLALSFALVGGSRAALAHEDEPSPKELAEVYHGMLRGVQELQRLAAEQVPDEAKRARVEGAFTMALFRFLKLYELTVKAECPECKVPEIVKVDPGKLAAIRR